MSNATAPETDIEGLAAKSELKPVSETSLEQTIDFSSLRQRRDAVSRKSSCGKVADSSPRKLSESKKPRSNIFLKGSSSRERTAASP